MGRPNQAFYETFYCNIFKQKQMVAISATGHYTNVARIVAISCPGCCPATLNRAFKMFEVYVFFGEKQPIKGRFLLKRSAKNCFENCVSLGDTNLKSKRPC